NRYLRPPGGPSQHLPEDLRHRQQARQLTPARSSRCETSVGPAVHWLQAFSKLIYSVRGTMRSNHIARGCFGTAILLLSGCGGGNSAGGGNNNQPPAAPSVIAATPAIGATGVSASNPGISATFSEAMTASTITASTFTLSGGGSGVSGTVSYSSGNDQATFTAAAPLAGNTTYTATI